MASGAGDEVQSHIAVVRHADCILQIQAARLFRAEGRARKDNLRPCDRRCDAAPTIALWRIRPLVNKWTCNQSSQ